MIVRPEESMRSNGNDLVAIDIIGAGIGEKVLVAHNFRGSTVTVPLSGYSTENVLVANGSISKASNGITMGAYSSVVYKQ